MLYTSLSDMRRISLIALAVLLSFGCADSGDKAKTADDREQSNKVAETDTTTAAPPRPFDRETAETLAAMYFSDLNREAKFPKYKGLLIAIDTPLPVGAGGTAAFRARIDGRIWNTPNGDTITLPYRDTLAFTASWDGQKWTAGVRE